MNPLGKLLIAAGALLVMLGLVVLVFGKLNFPLGRLPGDITYRGKNTVFYFPLASSLLLSAVLTLVLWLIQHFRR